MRTPFNPGKFPLGGPGAPGFGPEFEGEGDGPRGEGGRGRGGKGGGRGRGPGFGPGFGGHGGRPFGPRGRGRGGSPEAPDASDAAGWFAGRLPSDWFVGTPTVTVDREEVLIVGELPALETTTEKQDAAAVAAAEAGRIARFREDTREARIEIARQGQFRYGREISWGAKLGGSEELFTTASVPVMTRLRQPERQILDTLVDSGVARSRSDALVWAIRLVGDHADEWLGELREAMEQVNRLRNEGPDLG
ncbi:Arc/MetJ-type ribon-helix-helix transcriptional regulator [Nakamurella sp. UYEF19]